MKFSVFGSCNEFSKYNAVSLASAAENVVQYIRKKDYFCSPCHQSMSAFRGVLQQLQRSLVLHYGRWCDLKTRPQKRDTNHEAGETNPLTHKSACTEDQGLLLSERWDSGGRGGACLCWPQPGWAPSRAGPAAELPVCFSIHPSSWDLAEDAHGL